MKNAEKQISTKKLAKKALKNKPKWKTSKGHVYLSSVNPGQLFETEFGLKGILLECDVNAKVLIDMVKTTISSNTEVKIIRAV